MREEFINQELSSSENIVFYPRPKLLNANRKIHGVQHLSGLGNKKADIVFVGPCVLEEEINSYSSSPCLLKSPAGDLFLRQLTRVHLDLDNIYYTTLCKHTLPRKQKLKADSNDIYWNELILDNEISAIKPKLVVCLGASVFKYLSKIVIKFNDVIGGLFDCPLYNCKLYAMDNITNAIYKPEKVDKQQIDLYEVKRIYDSIKNINIKTYELDYKEINTVEDLDKYFSFVESEKKKALSVDCEWRGQTYVDGKLRSIQFCHTPGSARYVGFFDEFGKNKFDRPFDEVTKYFSRLNDFKDLKWIGHNLSADFVWMHNHLNINVYKKALFDTMFAEMDCDEYADLKLERLSVKYSDLGMYNISLLLEKKKLRISKDEGYERIPDSILIPYACRDVDVPMRAFPKIMHQLEKQDLSEYYLNVTLPLVTDGFVTMMETGIPISNSLLDSMRDQFVEVRNILNKDVINKITSEAFSKLLEKLFDVIDKKLLDSFYTDLINSLQAYDYNKFMEICNTCIKPNISFEFFTTLLPFINHYFNARNFNIRSHNDMSLWLYKIKGLTPVKTTKKEGYSIPWSRVLELPEQQQKDYTPAVDKQTLEILSEDSLVYKVLEVNNVGNIVKSFLREPDPETGKELGIHKWIQSDNCIHANFALTESARPRSWNPNILNWPKHINKSIIDAFEQLNKKLETNYNPISLRSVIEAKPGYCIVDSDLDTAEVISLAYLANDEVMIAACTERDTQFIEVNKAKAEEFGYKPFSFKKGYYLRRIEKSLLSSELNSMLEDNMFVRESDISKVALLSNNEIIHPKRDLHWELAEIAFEKPRELMDEDTDRGGGKVGNFCIAEGELVLTDQGLIPIEDICDYHKLWDGIDFVKHDGLLDKGYGWVSYYDNLWATDGHIVWDKNGKKTQFKTASLEQVGLCKAQGTSGEPISIWFEDSTRDCKVRRKRLFFRNYRTQDSSYVEKWIQRAGDFGISREECLRKTKIGYRWARVYDILNAGPRHRFTCSGCLVSNSIPYGATGGLLNTMIEALTGKRPPEDTGDRLIVGYNNKWKKASAFLLLQEQIVDDPGYYRSISGKIRHFHHLQKLKAVSGVNQRIFDSLAASLFREARNYPMQHIVAYHMAKAILKNIEYCHQLSLKSRPMLYLYDAMSSHCPIEERFIVADLHKKCMSLENTHIINGKKLQYSIDTGFYYRLGLSPSKEEKLQLNDKTWQNLQNSNLKYATLN